MKLEFLGSGGNSPIPTPTCRCEVCAEARTEGIPYARRGNSMYLHDLNALIDAPEYAFSNLNRAGIDRLEYVFLTHWHPDHVNGLRVVQSRDLRSFFRNPDRGLLDAASEDRPTLVTTRAVYERTCETSARSDTSSRRPASPTRTFSTRSRCPSATTRFRRSPTRSKTPIRSPMPRPSSSNPTDGRS
jgi:phosphoribosyl 1,2-cyclic phosphate phosphodiesterase